jgi:hypothetical protein
MMTIISSLLDFNRLNTLSQIIDSRPNSNSPIFSEIIKHPIWTPLSVVAAIIAILVSLLIAHSQSQKKDFSYYILSNASILSISDDIKSRIAITFDNKIIDNLNLLIIRFKNTGKSSIKADEYEHPIWIDFGDSSEILSVDVIKKEPSNLNIFVKNNPLGQSTRQSNCDFISINPVMLNSGDYYELKILVTEFKQVNVDTRIVGIKKIRRSDISRKSTEIVSKLLMLMLLFLLSPIMFLVVVLTAAHTPLQSLGSLLVYLAMLTGISCWILDIKLLEILKKIKKKSSP